MKKIFTLLLILLLTGTVLLASAEEKSVTIGITNTITSLNPLAMDITESTKYACSLTFLPLLELDRSMNFVPQLASSITTEDNTTFTITLRDDARWSDGTPVTSQDVAFTMVLNSDPLTFNTAQPM